MKELSIEQKAKAYDEAKARMSRAFNSNRCTLGFMNEIFPELKESEDERISKEIIKYLERTVPHHHRDEVLKSKEWTAWLEKQGEQEPTDKIEQKFKIGDWIVQNNIGIYKIVEICESWYEVIDNQNNHYSIGFDKEYMCHLWTIQDAKYGDVLQLGEVTAIFQKYIGNGNCKCYCSVCDGVFEIPSKDGDDNSYGCYNAIPATKEQRDTLFKKIKEAGYVWYPNSKELYKLIRIHYD